MGQGCQWGAWCAGAGLASACEQAEGKRSQDWAERGEKGKSWAVLGRAGGKEGGDGLGRFGFLGWVDFLFIWVFLFSISICHFTPIQIQT